MSPSELQLARRRGGESIHNNHKEVPMEPTTASALSAEEIRGLFASDYVEVVVGPDGSIRAADDDDSDVATRSLKRSRTWYAGA